MECFLFALLATVTRWWTESHNLLYSLRTIIGKARAMLKQAGWKTWFCCRRSKKRRLWRTLRSATWTILFSYPLTTHPGHYFHRELTPCLAWQHCGLLERRYCILYLRFFCFSLGVFFVLPGWLSVRKMGPIVDERACLCLPSASVTVFVRLRVKPAEYYHNIIQKRKLFKPFVCMNSTP